MEAIINNFTEQYLVPRNLPKEIFTFEENIGGEYAVTTPNGATIIWNGNKWLYYMYNGQIFAYSNSCNINELLDEAAEQYQDKQDAKRFREMAKK